MRDLKLLFENIENADIRDYTELLFNIYEDSIYYTVEASFDDEAFIIGREDPFIICEKTVQWQKVESDFESELKARIKKYKDTYKQFASIACGFVDGDLHYIRKPRKKNKEIRHYSADDFKDFESHKLTAWLAVYLTDEAKEKYRFNTMSMMFTELSEEQHKYWREILAENFNYEKLE